MYPSLSLYMVTDFPHQNDYFVRFGSFEKKGGFRKCTCLLGLDKLSLTAVAGPVNLIQRNIFSLVLLLTKV